MRYAEYISRIGLMNDPNLSTEDFKQKLDSFKKDVISSRFDKDDAKYSDVTGRELAFESAKDYLRVLSGKHKIDIDDELNVNWYDIAHNYGLSIKITGRSHFNNSWNTDEESRWFRNGPNQHHRILVWIEKIRNENSDEDITVYYLLPQYTKRIGTLKEFKEKFINATFTQHILK